MSLRYDNDNNNDNETDLFRIEHKCTGSVIRELCETRDSCNTQFFERKELLYLIEMLCTN